MASQINSCSSCRATWTGEGRAHCTACHELFSVASLFDHHRYYGKCRSLARVKTNKGEPLAFKNDEGMWRYAATHPRSNDD